MNDFDYENLQKKRIASGARHMKRGSKSKKCMLPSDHLTPAQLKRKNGDVKVMSMNQAVQWSEFKGWPQDIQKEYLEYRMKEFDCTMAGLAEILNADVANLRKTMQTIGFDMSRFVVGRKMTKENRARMLAWIKESRPDAALRTYGKKKAVAKNNLSAEKIVVEPTDNAPVPETTAVVPVAKCSVVEPQISRPSLMKTPFVKMDFIGQLNPTQIVNTLLALAKGCDVKVSVTLEYQEV